MAVAERVIEVRHTKRKRARHCEICTQRVADLESLRRGHGMVLCPRCRVLCEQEAVGR